MKKHVNELWTHTFYKNIKSIKKKYSRKPCKWITHLRTQKNGIFLESELWIEVISVSGPARPRYIVIGRLFFAFMFKLNTEKNFTILGRIWIHFLTWICGSESISKLYGSEALVGYNLLSFFNRFIKLILTVGLQIHLPNYLFRGYYDK